MAIKAENILIVGSPIYADNAETGKPFARIYDDKFKVGSNMSYKNKTYIGKVKSIDEVANGFVFVELAKEVATIKTSVYKDTTTIKKGKTKTAYFKLSEINTQRATIVSMKTKYCKGTNVNVRPTASVEKKAIAVLTKGQPVSVTGVVKLGFAEISVIDAKGSPLKGWVFATYLSDTVPTAEVTATVIAKKKVKKRKAGAVPSQKPEVEVADYEPPTEGDSIEIEGEDGKKGYSVVAKDSSPVNFIGIAIGLMVFSGLAWFGYGAYKRRKAQAAMPTRDPNIK
jgi:hypothetical protein